MIPCRVRFAAVVAFSVPLVAQKAIPEPRVGIAITPPAHWVELPAGGDRGATVRLFAAPRAMSSKGEASQTPILRVMFFQKGGDPGKDVVDGLPRQTPFRGLEDFAVRGLGMKEVTHEAGKAGALASQRVSGKGGGDLVLMGHALTLDDGECGVCVVALANQVDKVRKEADAAFASIASVPRAAGAPRVDAPWIADAEWSKKDAATRAATRRKWAEEIVAATAKAPEAGFTVSKSKYWTVLSSADAAFVKKAVAAAEAGRAWCEKKLPELCKEPQLPAVLRIFDSQDHFNAYQATLADNREYDALRRELLFCPEEGGVAGFGTLFRAVLWHLFDDIDAGVLPALPRWLDNGCWEYMRSTKFDGKKLDFLSSETETGRIANDQHANLMPNLWDLIQEHMQVSPKDGGDEKEWGYTPESARLMRWFWDHDGQKAFDKPSLVADYIRGLGAAYAQLGPDPTSDVAVIDLSEAQKKERNTRHYKWRDDLLIKVNTIVVPLQGDVWRAINDKWLAFNKTFK
jgi:hypothetical protein